MDEKGRRDVKELTDRELMEEMVLTIRRTEDTVTSFMNSLATNPMFAMFAKRMSK